MSLSDQQYEFVKDLHLLLGFIIDDPRIDKCSIGEVWRRDFPFPVYDKKGEEYHSIQNMLIKMGWSKTRASNHLYKLAVDIFFWVDEKFVDNEKENIGLLAHVGKYWESLHLKNKWGGHYKSFVDINHFERMRKM